MPQDEAQRPGPGQQRWHAVLVYFGLANPYPWDEPAAEPDPEPYLTGWRRWLVQAVILVVPVIVAFLARGPALGLVAAGIAVAVAALYSPLGTGLRARFAWLDDFGSTIGVVVLVNLAYDDDDVPFLPWLAALLAFIAAIFVLARALKRLEPPRLDDESVRT